MNLWYKCSNIPILVSISIECQFQNTHYNKLLWAGAKFLVDFLPHLPVGRYRISCELLTMFTYFILTMCFGISWAWVLGFRDYHKLIPEYLKRCTLSWFFHEVFNHICFGTKLYREFIIFNLICYKIVSDVYLLCTITDLCLAVIFQKNSTFIVLIYNVLKNITYLSVQPTSVP